MLILKLVIIVIVYNDDTINTKFQNKLFTIEIRIDADAVSNRKKLSPFGIIINFILTQNSLIFYVKICKEKLQMTNSIYIFCVYYFILGYRAYYYFYNYRILWEVTMNDVKQANSFKNAKYGSDVRIIHIFSIWLCLFINI